VTYEGTIERLFDAPPELVFDTVVNPEVQDELFSDVVQGWKLREFSIDLRVGGKWTVVFGPADGTGEADRLTSVFTVVAPPHRLEYDTSMYVSEWGRTVSYSESMTFQEQDGKTLLRIEMHGFETEADRDAFMSGTPDFLNALQRVVASRSNEGR
jgi:uncharacterized protein YndB with AHSA1/START domain